jgi:hypothetical protein
MTVEEARMILNLKAQEGGVVEEAKERLTKVSSASCTAEAAKSRNRITYTLITLLSSTVIRSPLRRERPAGSKRSEGRWIRVVLHAVKGG